MSNKKVLTLAIIAAMIYLFFKNRAEAQSATSGTDVSWIDSLNQAVSQLGSALLSGGSYNGNSGGAGVPAGSGSFDAQGVGCCDGKSDSAPTSPATLNLAPAGGGGFLFRGVSVSA